MSANSTRMRRVTALLNAISDLRAGDLRAVLELDLVTPLCEFGENDIFELNKDGKIVHIPGHPPPPKSLKDKVRTGERLARILENQLREIMAMGEGMLPSSRKNRRGKDFGGRTF